MTSSLLPTRDELLMNLRAFLRDERGIDSELVTEEANLIDDLGLDSLDLMVIAQGWAKDYDLDFNDEAIFNITTVGQALSFVIERTRTRGES